MAERHALVVDAQGNAELRYIDVDGGEIKRIIGGWLEAISPSTDEFGFWHAYCDEEGAYKYDEPNRNGTIIAYALGWRGVSAHPSGYLAGPMVFLGPGEGDPHGEGDFPLEATAHVVFMFNAAKARDN